MQDINITGVQIHYKTSDVKNPSSMVYYSTIGSGVDDIRCNALNINIDNEPFTDYVTEYCKYDNCHFWRN